jgi:hypothetical protein
MINYSAHMIPLRAVVALLVVIAAWTTLYAGQSADPATVLASTRQALGGGIALDAVRSFAVEGRLTRDLGAIQTESDLELFYQAPDKFVRVERMSPRGAPIDYVVTTRSGFNGDKYIRESDSTGPFPAQLPGSRTVPAEAVAGQRREALHYLLPLLGAGLAAYPLTFGVVSPEAVDGRPTLSVEARTPEGFVFRLLVDAAQSQPVQLRWFAKPMVVVSTSSRVVVVEPSGAGGTNRFMPPSLPPPVLPTNPTAGMADVEYRMAIGEYRSVSGLTWPTRFTTTAAGKKVEDVRLKVFKINPSIKETTFNASR